MKYIKKLLCFAIAAMMLCSLGCSDDDKSTAEKTGDNGSDLPYQYDLTDYVKLGQYKGIEYEKTVVTVTDEDVKAKLESVLTENATLTETDEPAKEGDTVTIEYVGKSDGAAFEGGSTTAPVDIVLGSSGYISGFDDGVIGMKKGETKDINCTFPDPYPRNTDLSGKSAVFTVTVNTVKTNVLPEYNDEFVKNVSIEKYETTAEYNEYLKGVVKGELEEEAETKRLQSIWKKVFDNATIYSCPQTEIDRYTKQYNEYYKSDADNYGVSFEDYLSGMYSLTEEQFTEQLASYVQNVVEEELVLNAIIKAENIELSDEEYEDWMQRYVDSNDDVDSIDDMKKKYSESEIKQRALADKGLEFVYDNAVEVDATTGGASETTAESQTTDTTESTAATTTIATN